MALSSNHSAGLSLQHEPSCEELQKHNRIDSYYQQIEKALAHPDCAVRHAALTIFPNWMPEQIEKALTDTCWGVRHKAITLYHQIFTSEQVERALTDNEFWVRYKILQVKGTTLAFSQIDRATKDTNIWIKKLALVCMSIMRAEHGVYQ